jgi:hypothetical protein
MSVRCSRVTELSGVSYGRCLCVCVVVVSVVVECEDADFDGEIERRDSCTLRESFAAINNAFITVRVTAL